MSHLDKRVPLRKACLGLLAAGALMPWGVSQAAGAIRAA